MSLNRRLFIMAGLSGLALPAAAFAQLRQDERDVWVGRKLTHGERANVEVAGTVIKEKLIGLPGVEFAMLDNHYRVRIPDHLVYEHDKDVLSKDGVRLATLVAEAIVNRRNVRMDIVTHHHAGEHSYATANLTRTRSAAFRAALMSRQVSGEVLKATGLGDRFPIASNEDYDGRARNRRTELLIRPANPKNPIGTE